MFSLGNQCQVWHETRLDVPRSEGPKQGSVFRQGKYEDDYASPSKGKGKGKSKGKSKGKHLGFAI